MAGHTFLNGMKGLPKPSYTMGFYTYFFGHNTP